MRRKKAGNTKPDWPKNRTAKWKLHRPSKFFRWVAVGPGENRSARRWTQRKHRKMMAAASRK